MTSKVVLLLGSNVGDKIAQLKFAIKEISLKIGIVSAKSAIYESAPWGEEKQPSFLNQVIIVESDLLPFQILEKTQAIEQKAGRIARGKWKMRELDIDILFYEDRVVNQEKLQIPHPYIQKRFFTLAPLFEIMPEFIHPIIKKSISDLYNNCDKSLMVKKYEI